MNTPTVRTSYDDVPYPSYPMPQTHPDHLATLATLLGLHPPPPTRCRILELGCASGGNLIPLAISLPQSSLVGIDMSREQIDAGQSTVDGLGLNNVVLRQLSILDVDDSLGMFDYILCHGVYSWVPAEVQQRILEICRKQLNPNGIAYISYNTHPGWHLRGVIRHMMGFHVGRFPEDPPDRKVARARRLLDFLARAAPERDRPYSALLQEHAELLRQHSDAYLFHEHLEEHNEPVWFLDFCERLENHGLRYLAEAEFRSMLSGYLFPPDVQQELEELAPHLLEKEQYMDFVRNRSFRQTLICHDHQRPDYEIRAERLTELFVAAPVRPVSSAVELAGETPETFSCSDGPTVTSETPIVKAALACLGDAWPLAIEFDALVDQARDRLVGLSGGSDQAESADRSHDRAVLGQSLLLTYAQGPASLLRLSMQPPHVAASNAERPLASPLARQQAVRQQPITNLRHESIVVSPFDRHLLPLLDGTRDRTALLTGLFERYQQGLLSISQEEQPVEDPARAQAILAVLLDQQLPTLAQASLLLPSNETEPLQDLGE